MIQRPCNGPGLRLLTTDLVTLDTPILKVISTLLIIVPLSCNGLRLRKSGQFGRIFFAFLLLGLTTDLLLWYINSTGSQLDPIYIFNFYAMAEALFFFWIIQAVSPAPLLNKAAGYFLILTPLAWAILLRFPFFESGKAVNSMPFVVMYEVLVSFLSGLALLALAEKEEELWRSWRFWFLLAIFFYCFCTFFVMTFIGQKLLANLWPLTNIINMVTYSFYTLGWWRYGKMGEKSIA